MTLSGRSVVDSIQRRPELLFGAAFVVAIGGFWPSFFSRLGGTDPAHLIHGVTATIWMAIPVVQAWLIGRHRYRTHRALGRATLLVAPLLVASGLHMVQLMIQRYHRIQALRLLKFAFLDLGALALFAVFLVLAVRSARRREIRAHVHYMAGTVLFALEPAIERVYVFFVPGVDGFAQALYLALITMEAIVAALLIADRRRSGRWSPALFAVLAFFAAMHVLVTPVASSPLFQQFCDWFAAI